ncbi:hypothetical protein MKX01_038770 [Papaver californicum]|nr:hypothetical protein MKX01_038770 [Papaver californicum]
MLAPLCYVLDGAKIKFGFGPSFTPTIVDAPVDQKLGKPKAVSNSISQTVLFMILLWLTSSLITPLTAAAVEENSNLSAYEILQVYGFPVGLLPVGVTGYELDKSSGKFAVYFCAGDCSFPLSGYQLKYKSTTTGIISNGKLTNLSGISVKVLFVWANIIEVLKSDQLKFSIGIASAYFSIDIYDSPKCGCGIKCKPWVNPFIVSSS